MNLSAQHYSRNLQKYYRLPSIQVSLTLVLSLFIVAFFIIFALGPTIVAVVSLQKNITDSRTTLQQLEAKVLVLRKISTEFEVLKPSLPTLNLDIPNTGSSYSPLVLVVESLARQTGVSVQTESIGSTLLYSRILSPFTPNRVQSIVTLPLTLQVAGPYPQVSSFLSKLLSMERIVTLDSVTITRNTSTKNGDTLVSLQMSGNAYYLADDTQLKKAMPVAKDIQ